MKSSKPTKRLQSPFQEFVGSESFGGILLVATATIAFIWANSGAAASYFALKEVPISLRVGSFALDKNLLLVVNDFLMAIFFLFVGLEIKREILVGELKDRAARVLPVAAALGGMIVPAAIYLAFNLGTAGKAGWGIPMATDIAFALGVLSLLGSRVPLSLKIFLTALAIIDDLGAILVIAFFYSGGIDKASLGLAFALFFVAMAYGRFGQGKLKIFALLGVLLWYFMLKSGIHATIAGVLLAFTVPMSRRHEPARLASSVQEMLKHHSLLDSRDAELAQLQDLVKQSQDPLHRLEHALQPWVAFFILPIFAFLNAGFAIGGDIQLSSPIALGAFFGLLIGKPLGILLACFIAGKLFGSRLAEISWSALAGTSLLAGIGFTMSLFIAALAFNDGNSLDEQAKLGVLAASVAAAGFGLSILHFSLPKKTESL